MISDGEHASAMRVIALVIVVPIMVVWTVLCIKQGQFIIPDWRIVSLVVSAVGGKTLQSFAENFASDFAAHGEANPVHPANPVSTPNPSTYP